MSHAAHAGAPRPLESEFDYRPACLRIQSGARDDELRRSGAYRDRYKGCEVPHAGARRAADSSCEARALVPMRRDKWLLRAATSAVPAVRIRRSASYGTSAAARDSMLPARMLRPDFATVNVASTLSPRPACNVRWRSMMLQHAA
jgi:hypothetical protein